MWADRHDPLQAHTHIAPNFCRVSVARPWQESISDRNRETASAASDLAWRLRRFLYSGRQAGVRLTVHHLLTDGGAGNSGGAASPVFGSQRYRTPTARARAGHIPSGRENTVMTAAPYVECDHSP